MALNSRHCGNPLQGIIAVFCDLLHELIHTIKALFQAGNTSHLRKQIDAADGRIHHRGFYKVIVVFLIGRIYAANTQAGHTESLGEAIHGKGAFIALRSKLQQAVEVSFRVDHIRPDLIVHDVESILFGQGQQIIQILFCIQHPHRVMRVAETDHFGFWGDVIFQPFQADTVLFQIRGEQFDGCTGVRHRGTEQEIHGVKHKALIPRLQERIRNHLHTTGSTVNGQHIFSFHRLVLTLTETFCEILFKSFHAAVFDIREVTILNVIRQGFYHFRCTGEIMVSCRERNDTIGDFGPAKVMGTFL